MTHYIDIRIRPDPEFSASMLMSALFNKLHRILVTLEVDNIGISFPDHKRKPQALGNILRIHGHSESLAELMKQPWLNGMHDHIQISDMRLVPDNASYRIVRRRQFKTNADRLRRRRMKRHGETYGQAVKHIPDDVERKVDLPFVTVRSQSTGQPFSLFIEHGELRERPTPGAFNRYGLSTTATIPWF